MIKKFRWWLAEKLIGSKIDSLDEHKAKWTKEQLELGNKISIQYEVHTIQ